MVKDLLNNVANVIQIDDVPLASELMKYLDQLKKSLPTDKRINFDL